MKISELRTSGLRELIHKTIQEVKSASIKEIEYISPQEKAAQRKLELSKIELARAAQVQAQKNISSIR